MTRTYRIYAVYDLEDPAKDCNEFGHDGMLRMGRRGQAILPFHI